MQLTINLNIENAISKAINEEVMGPVIEKAVFGAVKSAIEDATGYSSEFRKVLKEQLINTLPHGLDLNDLTKFQFILNNAITDVVNQTNTDTVAVAMRAAVKNVVPEADPVIKVSELLEKCREVFSLEQYEAFYAYFEESSYGGGTLFIDSDPDVGKSRYTLSGVSSYNKDRHDQRYSAKYRFSFNEKGEVYSMHLDGKDLRPMAVPTVISQFDTLMLALYVGRTIIELDMDDGDVRAAAEVQYG
jgi:hypothetical protein